MIHDHLVLPSHFGESQIFSERRKAFTEIIKTHSPLFEGTLILIAAPFSIHYLTGFVSLVPEEREAFLIYFQQKWYLIHAAFSPTDSVLSGSDLNLLTGTFATSLSQHLVEITKTGTCDHVLVDKASVTIAEFETITSVLDQRILSNLNPEWLWQLKVIKDDIEISYLKTAGQIAAKAFNMLLPQLQAGQSEKDVAVLLETTMARLGADQPAFPTIVAFGKNGALPHYQPSHTTLLENEMAVLLDFGARYCGYRSDMSRSFWFGSHPDSEYLMIEKLVQTAYQAALEKLPSYLIVTHEHLEQAHIKQAHPNDRSFSVAKNADNYPTAQVIDTAARTVIRHAGFGKEFIHTTGHGVGLAIHEPPSISWSNKDIIKPGMVITIEPGIYVTEKWGYRHENTVLVK